VKFTPKQMLEALSTGDTVRFHTRKVINRQDVAAHSWQVALLCYMLMGGNVRKELMLAALQHDMGERWTGDVPSPVKRASKELNDRLEQLEQDSLLAHTGLPVVQLSPWEALVLDVADRLSGAYYCYAERLQGNQLLEGAFNRYLEYIEELPDKPLATPFLVQHLKDLYDRIP
jgi:5'-deoxynucleotidase YfbR-like HD superfamily hydrolase